MRRVTIIGTGFAGLPSIRQLRRADTDLEITVISPVDELHYLPGIIWIPKQARMADLQAETAARNLLGELNGTATDATFKVELICIVDTNNKGILVSRSERSNYMLPGNILFHWMKRGF